MSIKHVLLLNMFQNKIEYVAGICIFLWTYVAYVLYITYDSREFPKLLSSAIILNSNLYAEMFFKLRIVYFKIRKFNIHNVL